MATLIPRLLFITGNRIGDAVLSSGVLAQAIEARPELRVTVACGALPAPLFADVPGLERLHMMVKRPWSGHWRDLWRASVGHRWASVIDLRGSLFPWTVRADRRVVCRAHFRREHRIEELARCLGLPLLPEPRLWVSSARASRTAGRLGGALPILAVGPTANWRAKQWPADRFAAAITRLTGADGILPGARVAVFGAKAERALAQPVLEAIPPERRLDFIGEADLLDCFALLRQCSFYLGNDSGLMHMAAAAGIPTLGLFGPSPEWRYGPRGPKTAVVRTAESFETLVVNSPTFDHHAEACLMGSLSVDAVVEGSRALWADASEGRPQTWGMAKPGV